MSGAAREDISHLYRRIEELQAELRGRELTIAMLKGLAAAPRRGPRFRCPHCRRRIES